MPGELGVEHIIWDWNGTLFADSEALIESTIEAFASAGLSPITRARYQELHQQPIPAFYDSLVGRRLTDTEQTRLDELFRRAYLARREYIPLTHDAVDAMSLWRSAGGSQSLLSMYPHEALVVLVEKFGIASYFQAVDGLTGTESGRKAPHLQRHLRKLGVNPANAVLIGDSIDDAYAANECGVRSLIYHAGNAAVHALAHFTSLGLPTVASLDAAVTGVLAGTQHVREATSQMYRPREGS